VKLHVLTACTRPLNLPQMTASLLEWGRDADIEWHISFDLKRTAIGGQRIKNDMLDQIEWGYVFFLDDDTVAHPLLYERAQKALAGVAPAVVFSQEHSELGTLHAAPENVTIGGIDIGQAIVRRDVIGDHRIPETYAGDGEFYEAVLRGREDVVYLDEVLSFHNALE
jgi:hypothetical protein